MIWLLHTLVAQAEIPIPWDKITGFGGGGLGIVVATVVVADRLGFLKRKGSNGNGHTSDYSPIVNAIKEGNKEIVHQLERMNDKAEDNAREILLALNRRDGGI